MTVSAVRAGEEETGGTGGIGGISEEERLENIEILYPTAEKKRRAAVGFHRDGTTLSDASDEELDLYRRAMEIDPAYAPPYYNTGLVLMHRGRLEEALAVFEKYLDRSADEETKQSVADTMEQMRRVIEEERNRGKEKGKAPRVRRVEIVKRLPPITEEGTRDWGALKWYNEALRYGNYGQEAEEVRCYEAALALDPDLAEASFNLAVMAYRAGNYAEAKRRFEAYLEKAGNPPDAEEVKTLIEVCAAQPPAS